MENISLLINFILALISVGAWLQNRRESKSKIDNLDVATDKLRNELVMELDAQFETFKKRMLERNKELELQIEILQRTSKEREEAYGIERNAKREELNGILAQLRTVQDMNSSFVNKFDTMQKIDMEKDERIRGLEKDNFRLKELVDQHSRILRKTGQLPSRDELNKNV